MVSYVLGGYHIWQVNYKFFFLGACKFPCQIEDVEMLNQQVPKM
jgi:hypothetical protein